MIKQISRKNLDLDKYTACIVSSTNYRVYAEVWYLDVVADNNWYCLVLNDYEAVMPIPYQRKFGLKFVIQPYYCQQLGVFHGEQFTKKQFKQFEQKLHRKLVRSYHFNEENTEIFSPKGEKRTNYVLDLNNTDLHYNKKTKNNCKTFRNKKVEILTKFDLKQLLKFKKENSAHSANYDLLKKLLTALNKRDRVKVKFAKQEQNMLAFSCFVYSKNRIIYINSSASRMGKKLCAPTGLIHEVINQHHLHDYIFDFEGSDHPNISQFFEGFGPDKKIYTVYKTFNVFKS